MEQRVLNFHSVLHVSAISKPVGTSGMPVQAGSLPNCAPAGGPGWGMVVQVELLRAGAAALCSVHPRVMLGNMDVWTVSLSRKREELGGQISLLARGTCEITLLETLIVAQAQASPCPLPKHRSTITGCASIITGRLYSW